jgi:hypothetical protein
MRRGRKPFSCSLTSRIFLQSVGRRKSSSRRFLPVVFLVATHKTRPQEGGSTACPHQQRVSLMRLLEGVDSIRRLIDRGDADHSGVMASPIEQVTAQKYDLQFGTNVIGDPRLAPSSPGWLMMCRSLVVYTTAVTCSVRSHRHITLPRESAHRDGILGH